MFPASQCVLAGFGGEGFVPVKRHSSMLFASHCVLAGFGGSDGLGVSEAGVLEGSLPLDTTPPFVLDGQLLLLQGRCGGAPQGHVSQAHLDPLACTHVRTSV